MTAQTITIGTVTYEAANSGTYFTKDCPHNLRVLLDTLRTSGATVRLFYGDTETGKAWAEENDVTGRIGRSLGTCKVPLLVKRGDSGGGAILDRCIVAVLCNNAFIYKVPGFDPGVWTVGPTDMQGFAEVAYQNGAVHARFKKPGQAERYCQFMRGERMGR